MEGADAPERLGKYPILEQIGRGAMGVVYKSFDPHIKRPIALKTIRKELLGDDRHGAQFASRFRHEAEALGRLLHHGIVAVYEYGEDEHFAFIAMEFVQGRSLREYFEGHRPFVAADAVAIMCQVLDALQFAHEHGVWHRDVKPANILISDGGQVKIADFGIARIESSNLTQDGSVLGTPGFIAPELYQGMEVDQRVDVFAAGVVLYQMLAGVPAFAGTRDQVMYQILHDQPKAISLAAQNEELARYDPIGDAAMARDRDRRFASAREFRAQLLQAHGQAPAERVPLERLKSMLPPEGAEPQRSTSGRQIAGAGSGWDRTQLDTLERSLARIVGPVARLKVREAARKTSDLGTLVEMLAQVLSEPKDREAFLAQHPGQLRSSPAKAKDKAKAKAEELDADATVIPGKAPVAGRSRDLTTSDCQRAAALLTRYIGPYAQIVTRRATRPGIGLEAFLEQVSQSLEPGDRQRFLEEFERGRR